MAPARDRGTSRAGGRRSPSPAGRPGPLLALVALVAAPAAAGLAAQQSSPPAPATVASAGPLGTALPSEGRRLALPADSPVVAPLTDSVALALRPGPAAAARAVEAEAGGGIFHRGLPYGSEAYAGPLDVLLNKGFALAQVMNRSQRVFGYDYGWAAVADALVRPLGAVERSGGWGEVVRSELLPLTADSHAARWWPNYFGHVVEGGITHRKTTEWFAHHGMPAPWLLATLTTAAAAVVNEAYENPGGERGSVGAVVDLYLMDPLGVALFSSDRVARFFARELNATVWPGQATLALPSGRLLNNANHLVLRPDWIPGAGDTALFFRTGIGGHLGLAFRGEDGLGWNLGAGADANRQRVDPATGVETVDLALSGGLYVDRNGSLLGSVQISQLEERAFTVNVYPGVAHERLGGWVNLRLDGGVEAGITGRGWLGAGVGVF